MKKLVFVFLMMGLLAGCKSDPYEGLPAVQPTAPDQKPEPAPVQDQTPPPPPVEKPVPYTLDAPDVLNFKEGQKGEFIIKAMVPAPGSPLLQFKDLPAGMQFDAMKMKLTWTPGYTDADDPAHPNNEQKVLVIEVQLSSSIDSVTMLVKKMVLIVQNTPHIGIGPVPALKLSSRPVLSVSQELHAQIENFQAPSEATLIDAEKNQIVFLKNQEGCESLLPVSETESLALQCLNPQTGEVETHLGFDLANDTRVIR